MYATVSEVCPGGTFRSEDKEQCEECAVNTVSTAGAGLCEECEIGYLANREQTECGEYSNQSSII